MGFFFDVVDMVISSSSVPNHNIESETSAMQLAYNNIIIRVPYFHLLNKV